MAYNSVGGNMPMYNNSFLRMVSGHPYRFFICASLLTLNTVSGISSNLMLYGKEESARLLAVLAQSGTPDVVPALCCALIWNLLLTCAVFYGRGGALRCLAAYAACACEGFSYGFALSALLFAYGAPRLFPVLLITAVCGMAGMVLRLYCLVYDPPGVEWNERPLRHWLRAYAPVWQGMLVNVVLEAVLLPYWLVWLQGAI